eukprot:4695149-Pyramimonas_sp.AAC.1
MDTKAYAVNTKGVNIKVVDTEGCGVAFEPAEYLEPSNGKLALVFGREDQGLTVRHSHRRIDP